MIRNLWLFNFLMLGIGLYFGTARELMLARGGFYIGGEIFLLGLPLYAVTIRGIFLEIRKELRK